MEIREHAKILSRSSIDPDILDKASLSIGIADAMNECLWLGDENHRTLYVNPVYEQTSGYSLQECLGRPSDFCFDEKSKKTIARHHELRKEGVPSQYEATMVSKTGKRIPVLVSGAPTKTGGTIGIFINLTKIKELSKKETLTRKILQHTDKAFVILDKDRKITLWNSGAKVLFGYKESEVLGKKIDIIVPEEEHGNKLITCIAEEKGHVPNIEAKRIRKSGTVIDVSVSVTKVTDNDENFIGYLLSYQDISRQKKYGNELQKRFEAVQDAYKELGLQKRHLDYFSEIAAAGAGTDTLESLERLIVSAMSMLTKCDGAIFRAYDGQSKSLNLRYCFGVNKNWWNKSKVRLKNSLAEEAFEKRRSLIVDHIDDHPKHRGQQLLKDHSFKVLILLPLYINDKLLGSISLYATNPDKFRFIETTFLENIAKLCSIAIHSKKIQKV